MHRISRLSRREFLKVAATHLAGAAVPIPLGNLLDIATPSRSLWPALDPDRLPYQVQRILPLIPNTRIDSAGYLNLYHPEAVIGEDKPLGRIPLAQTLWNIENSEPIDRLNTRKKWAVVLHWYGDRDGFDTTVRGYLRGFDSLRQVDTYQTRTSVHFLVTGNQSVTGKAVLDAEAPGILQTQAPDKDGIPFVASQIQDVYYGGEKQNTHYFIRALYQLSYTEPSIHNLLQDFVEKRHTDPNTQSIGIEIAGFGFENPEYEPSDQKIANTVSVVWAIMKRYRITSLNVLGHHEIQLSKPDPGKKFLTLIRFLIGVKALIEQDLQMKNLVFGPFVRPGVSSEQAVHNYFHFVRDYLSLVAPSRTVYEWEGTSGYWFLMDQLVPQGRSFPLASRFCLPLESLHIAAERYYTHPEAHEGLDLYKYTPPRSKIAGRQEVNLIAAGKCLSVSEMPGLCRGKMAVFRHRQEDGAELLSVYSRLENFGDLEVGQFYPAEYRVGAIQKDYHHSGSYLHMALAYRSVWDLNSRDIFASPLYAGALWVQDRFADPAQFLARFALHDERLLQKLRQEAE